MAHDLRDKIAKEIAMEIMEIHVPARRKEFNFPDDINGDTYSRAIDSADEVINLIIAYFEDHYWDSLESNKDIVMLHVKAMFGIEK